MGRRPPRLGACGPASRAGRGGPSAGGGGSRCLVAMGTAQLFPSPRRCQWLCARVRGYCRTAAICCGLGPNNAPLLLRWARGREALLIGGTGAAPRASHLLWGLRGEPGGPGPSWLHVLSPPPSSSPDNGGLRAGCLGALFHAKGPLISSHSRPHLSVCSTPQLPPAVPPLCAATSGLALTPKLP